MILPISKIAKIKKKAVMSDMESKILVIGSKSHKLADKCVTWNEKIPSMRDFHYILIYLPALQQDQIESLQQTLNQMQCQLNELIWANQMVYCITAPTSGGKLVSHHRSGAQIPSPTNYDWCPIYVHFASEDGDRFNMVDPFNNYLKYVKKWSHYLSEVEPRIYEPLDYAFMPDFDLQLLQTNLANNPLAFDLYVLERNRRTGNKRTSKPITFLPPTTTIPPEEGIDVLLKQIRKIENIEGYEFPAWVGSIKISGETDLENRLCEKHRIIEESNHEINDLNEQIKNLARYKQLLTEGGSGDSGLRLEEIVEDALKLIGFEVLPGTKGKEDRNIAYNKRGDSIPVEITGVKNSIPEQKLAQLIKHLPEELRPRPMEINCRGVLIGNAYKDKPLDTELSGRKAPFEDNVIEKSKPWNVCLLSTITLFKVVDDKLRGQDVSYFRNALFETEGELTL